VYLLTLILEVLINTLLLLAGVIPGHIHTFYLTCTISTENQKSKRADILDLPRAGSTVLRFGTVEQVTDVYTSYGCVNRTGKEEASEDVEEKKNDKKVPVIRNT
jgi:hypothetical protein